MGILESAPDADQNEVSALLYHLQRSFSPNDKNLQAQFWYARELCIAHHYDQALPIFRYLTQARAPYKQKVEVRGVLRNHDGAAREFAGSVSHCRADFGFVYCDQLQLRAWFSIRDVAPDLLDDLSTGVQVRYQLGFNLRGPVAIKIDL